MSNKPLTIEDLGWSREYAAAVRGAWMCAWEDWDDPEMDVYDDALLPEITSVNDLLNECEED